MARVVLHIGMHKTASTTLQDTFQHNARLLAEHGLIYPKLHKAPHITGHHGLAHDFVKTPSIYQLDTGSLGGFAQLAKDYAEREGTLFLSSEEFSRGRTAAQVDFGAVRQALAPFEAIEVIAVLRPQWQFLQSVYLELSKHRQPPRPPQLVEPVIKDRLFEGLWVDYNGLLDHLEAHFAPEEITLLSFAELCQAPGGVLGSFLDHLGLPLSAQALEPVNNGASNVSPMVLASWIANVMAEPRITPPWLVKEAEQAFRAELGDNLRPCLFTRGEFEQLAEHFDACNAVLRARRQAVQPDFNLPAADSSTLNIFRNAVPPQIWIRLCRRLTLRMLQSAAPKT